MGNVWTCRARMRGVPFPTFTGEYAGIELLNWQVTGTVLLRGPTRLVTAWATAESYTKPLPPLPGIYLVDADTLFYVSATAYLVSSAADVVYTLPPLPGVSRQLTQEQACELLVQQKRIFVLSDLNSFQVQNLLLGLFGIRSKPTDMVRFR